jgi:hypothetical protein
MKKRYGKKYYLYKKNETKFYKKFKIWCEEQKYDIEYFTLNEYKHLM